ncbi:DUF1365 domain-containing protein [Kordiimonas sp. SCSIO 12603]|uniref:DUF1365 domain-containing protein n=1 Tax=Kordiimonas sp. SCSIO 12603 TaxID=2829596 RepID=UPI002107806E|nr:DUF1365 domain-containing protein [Kordiimonas sp. SCSIO 12603]UTW57830.1 DUF1365 domain-containing protein [Kordiimonas sp. SCSIO 12603]
MASLFEEGLFLGHVWHKRRHVKKHAFRYPIFYLMVDVDQLDKKETVSKLLSYNRTNILSVWKQDYGHESGVGLKEQLLKESEKLTLQESINKIYMLTMPRVFGYSFNPITTYYCVSNCEELVAIFYEVHNTFGERITYGSAVSLNDRSGLVSPHSADKELHVSPFFQVEGSYKFHQKLSLSSLSLGIQYKKAGKCLLTAHLQADRKKISAANLFKALIRIPFVTLKTTIAIHYEAAKIWFKGIPFFKKPSAPDKQYSLAEDS